MHVTYGWIGDTQGFRLVRVIRLRVRGYGMLEVIVVIEHAISRDLLVAGAVEPKMA